MAVVIGRLGCIYMTLTLVSSMHINNTYMHISALSLGDACGTPFPFNSDHCTPHGYECNHQCDVGANDTDYK